MEKTLRIVKYNPADTAMRRAWDDFVVASRNGTFLHRRDYMDYHADRFTDCSVMVYAETRLIALLPASAHGEEVRSHGGLTYGGLILGYDGAVNADTVVDIFDALIQHYSAEGYSSLIYKAIPYIYHRYPSDEDIYALFRSGAIFYSCNVSSTIDLTQPIAFNERSRRNLKSAIKQGVTVAETTDFAPFWNVLTHLLDEKYGTKPVHSLEEIVRLHSIFPDNIRLVCAYAADGTILAGTVLYCTPICIHTQYIASTAQGREAGALAALFRYAIDQARDRANQAGDWSSDTNLSNRMEIAPRYFDFGTSNEDGGLILNTGLIEQKNGFGGRAVAYPTYTITL